MYNAMMYEATPHNDDWFVSDARHGVVQNRFCVRIHHPHAETYAKIFAFALNTIAGGHDLRMMHRDSHDFGSMARLDRIYEGPIEGVAP